MKKIYFAFAAIAAFLIGINFASAQSGYSGPVFSATKSGTVPAPPSASPTTKFLRGDATWAEPVGTSAVVTATATTESTTTATGAIISAGGLGVAKKITVGGIVTGTDATDSTTTATGAVITAGGLGVAKAATIGGAVNVTATTESTTTGTGAIITAGGIGVAKNATIGGTVTATGTIAGAGGQTNNAVCWKAGGVLGYCSVVVDASGVCGTCN